MNAAFSSSLKLMEKFYEIKNRTLKCGFIFHFFLAKNYANFLICAANLDLWFAALLA